MRKLLSILVLCIAAAGCSGPKTYPQPPNVHCRYGWNEFADRCFIHVNGYWVHRYHPGYYTYYYRHGYQHSYYHRGYYRWEHVEGYNY